MVTKCVMYQEALRVPLMIRLPGQSKTSYVTGPVSQVDVVPTLLELMGQQQPDHLQGTSLCNLISAGRVEPERNVVVQWTGDDGLLARDEESVPTGLKEKITQQEVSASHTELARTLKNRFVAWQRETGDTVELPRL